MTDPISVDDAKAIVAAQFGAGCLTGRSPVTEAVSTEHAIGRTLAEPVVGNEDIPPFDNSAMDGYAVRVVDLEQLPARLHLQSEVRAGEVHSGEIRPGCCIRIMTGAPVPEGADGIVPVEWTDGWVNDGDVVINRAPTTGQHVRRSGRDVRAGDTVFESGTVITPPVVGMLAALGRTSARVFQRPRVAVVATGDELVDSGARLLPGQIRNSNGPGLAAQVLAAGGELFYQAVARDNEASIIEHLTRGLGADILLISGGVSVGAYDFVRPALEALTVKILFWRVRQRPGKPLAFGRSETAAVFGLPGNPVSSAVCFEQYVRPAIRQFAGDVGRGRTVRALLEEPIEKKSDLYYFARGVVRYDESGTLVVRLAGEQGSNIYSSMVRSNCMIHLPEGVEAYAAGDQVRVEPYSWSGV